MSELRVRCRAQYLTDQVEQMRRKDFDATLLVKATKGLALGEKEYAAVTIGEKKVNIRETNKDIAIEWFAEWAAPLVDALGDQPKIIVPIPGSAVTILHPPDFRTALMAEAISVKCDPPVAFSTSLRWRKAQQSTRNGGPRDASLLYNNFTISARQLPDGDIVLIDDVFTLGGHLKAARWRFEDIGRTVLGALCCGKSTWEQLADPFNVQEEALDVAR